MSENWTSVNDGVHEWQQVTAPKPDAVTYVVRTIDQTARNPHACFDYNPKTGEFTSNHSSFSTRQHSGMREVMSTAISFLKDKKLL